MHPDANILY